VCGIVGVVAAGGAPADRDVVRRMTATLEHRGPDADGSFFAAGVGFGHRRLSIVDLSPASAQPMVGPRGTALTFNGEIYNWTTLRSLLAAKGRQVQSTGDTEVLLAALDTWGERALDEIEGMFAFGYWDPARRSLLVARDRFGEKPLYYLPLGDNGRDGLAFASELRALFEHPRVQADRAIDPVAVTQFFLHDFVPAPRSILSSVRKLPAGHMLRWVDGKGLEAEPYYEPACRRRPYARRDVPELVSELVRRTEDATRARLVADVPVGIFLSGGLDSSFLAACAARVHPRVKTFTIGFDHPSFDESAHARRVAEHLGTEHVEHRLSTEAMLELVPSTLDWIDEPFADASLVPTTLLARAARQEVTVALGGDGGDELLAGYPTFVVDQVLSRLPAWPAPLARLARLAATAVPADTGYFSTSFKARQFTQGLDASGARRHASWLASILPRDLLRVAGPRLREAGVGGAFDAVDACAGSAPTAFDAATAFYLKLYLGEGVLTKVDRATMRASLESRAPLLDSGVAQFCLSLPPRVCVHGSTTKWLMRKAVAALLPRSIVKRPKKGFGAPVGAWLRGPLRPLAEATLAPARLREGGWLDPSAISRMLAAHVAGTADHRKPLWAALVFEHWRQRRCPSA
jgi:asparagine synthase (glutamine-hydrolysing)